MTVYYTKHNFTGNLHCWEVSVKVEDTALIFKLGRSWKTNCRDILFSFAIGSKLPSLTKHYI